MGLDHLNRLSSADRGTGQLEISGDAPCDNPDRQHRYVLPEIPFLPVAISGAQVVLCSISATRILSASSRDRNRMAPGEHPEELVVPKMLSRRLPEAIGNSDGIPDMIKSEFAKAV